VLASRTADTEAWHAKAVAHMERGEPVLARRAARRALPDAHLVLAWIEQDAGNTLASQRHLDLASPSGELRFRAHCLRGLNLCVAGDYTSAHRELSLAITGSRRQADQHWLANALNARGVVNLSLHRLAAATRDLAAAVDLYTRLGERERAAICVHNRGAIALQAGDIPTALRFFDQAVEAGLRVNARGEAMIDRATALVAAGLLEDAATVLAEAARQLDGAGRGMRLAEATLALGECAARAGRRELAVVSAGRARALFRAQRRTGWMAAAESLELRLRLTAERVPAARRLAKRLLRHGFRVEAAELRLAVARITGDRGLLRTVAAERTSRSPRLRTLGWFARARLAELDGNRRAMFAACRADGGRELAGLAVSAALEAGEPRAVLRWNERVPVRELVGQLGDSALLSYIEMDGQLVAVSVVEGRVRLHRLGPLPEGVDRFRFIVGTQAKSTELAAGIDAALLAPVRPVIGDRALVMVPSAGLHGLPWAALPTCAGRAVSIAPSALAWLAASQQSSTMDRTVWVAGPGLRHAEREVTELHRAWGGTLLTGGDATVDAVLAAMEDAGLVHIAAHGRYRAEAPTFSSFELADRSLYGHDLDRLARQPRVMVLSACEGALPALLRPGMRALIASTVPVVDETAAELVTVLHRRLRVVGPAEALARAQGECGDRGFVCIGAG
jgi:tetratricopeptide (TPR) repeat protein